MPSSARAINLVWAQTTAGVIGRDNAIPWRLPEDLAHFKAVTMGHPVVMGRRTWDSLPPRHRPLAGRRNIVITRQPEWAQPGAEVAASLDAALELAGDVETWIAGGGEIYRAAMPLAHRLEVTEIAADLEGDAYAPDIDATWQVAARSPWQVSETSGLRFRWLSYLRNSAIEGCGGTAYSKGTLSHP